MQKKTRVMVMGVAQGMARVSGFVWSSLGYLVLPPAWGPILGHWEVVSCASGFLVGVSSPYSGLSFGLLLALGPFGGSHVVFCPPSATLGMVEAVCPFRRFSVRDRLCRRRAGFLCQVWCCGWDSAMMGLA
ncbi:hypothetical protein SUGI_0354700 [Cryptomeria japonica]|nr:hypothetical protein SUGI_0354700 [Cryptomeria japonica]